MLMVGAWNSMAVSLAAIGLGALIGIPLGLTASARKGWIDEAVMRFNDFAFAFPALLTAVMLSAALGPGSFNSIVAIGIFNIPVFARLTRGSSLSLFQRDFILAARIAGKGTHESVLNIFCRTSPVSSSFRLRFSLPSGSWLKQG